MEYINNTLIIKLWPLIGMIVIGAAAIVTAYVAGLTDNDYKQQEDLTNKRSLLEMREKATNNRLKELWTTDYEYQQLSKTLRDIRNELKALKEIA